MVFFIYKCYYVLFLYYSKFKKDVTWNSSIIMLSAVFVVHLMLAMKLSGLLDIIGPDPMTNSESTKKGKMLLFIIPLCVLVWNAIYYVVFNLAEASKTDGRSKRYSFDPTKRDKTVCWMFISLSFCLVFIFAGVKVLFDLK